MWGRHRLSDYAENYSHEPRIEHQSKYFSQVQTTIVPVVLMFRVEDLTNITEERSTELIEYFDAHDLPHVMHARDRRPMAFPSKRASVALPVRPELKGPGWDPYGELKSRSTRARNEKWLHGGARTASGGRR